MEREHAAHNLRGVYILLVDDDPRHSGLIREILRYCGAWVREVASADEALAVLREATPTALVVYVRSPGAEAWRLLRGVRAMRPEHGGKIPAVAVGPEALAAPALAEGFEAYLSEPVEAWRLCRTVAELTE
jgi:CheY-like chemotaxis protein